MADAIDRKFFESAAGALSTGQRTRVAHDCGDGETILVTKQAKGTSAYCFRCAGKGWLSSELSLADRMAALRAGGHDDEAQHYAAPPTPAEYDPQKWPAHARVWLYKAGFSNDDIEAFGWYWNPRMCRVILPVGENFWQGRGFDVNRAKYLNPHVDRSRVVAKFGSPGPVLVLTEDILSAAKVAKAGIWSWSCMGTVLPLAIAMEIVALGVPVIVGLDPDRAGFVGASRIARELTLFGARAAPAFMKKDPKFHSIKEIQEWVTTSLSSVAALAAPSS